MIMLQCTPAVWKPDDLVLTRKSCCQALIKKKNVYLTLLKFNYTV